MDGAQGFWIKMRAGLLDHPKVIAMTRILQTDPDFMQWVIPSNGASKTKNIVSHCALRAVTCALLMKVWSTSRDHGKFIGDHLVMEHSVIEDIDQMSAPGIGKAMEQVGWASSDGGVTFYNFKTYNVPLSNAERQKQYRGRALQPVTKSNDDTVTSALPEEKRKEKKRTKNKPSAKITSREKLSNIPHLSDPIGIAITEAFKLTPQTKSEFSSLGKIVKDLRSKLATPDEIQLRISRWNMWFPNAHLTEHALLKHWDRLGNKPEGEYVDSNECPYPIDTPAYKSWQESQNKEINI